MIRQYINDLHKFKQANPSKEIKQHRRRLLYFLFVLVLYTPLYIALDNAWPWTFVARCQLQKVCIDSELGVCIYEIVRGGFLGAILIFTTLNLGSVYCSNWCEKSHRTRMEDKIDGPVTRQQRSADQNDETIGLLSQQRSADQDGETIGLLSQQRSADQDGETIGLLSQQRSADQDGVTIGLLSQQRSGDQVVK